MLLEWDYSLLGIVCTAWTVLLALLSYIFISRRQQKLLQKIEETNRINQELAEMNSKMEKQIKEIKSEHCEISEEKQEKNENEEEEVGANDTTPIVSSDEIVLESTTGTSDERDPFEYVEHIQGEVKRLKQKATQKKYMQDLTPNQMEEEREVRRKQMEAIFQLMAETEGKFGMNSMEDVQNQMKMYL